MGGGGGGGGGIGGGGGRVGGGEGVGPAAWQRVARVLHGGVIVAPLAAARIAWWAVARALDRLAAAGPRRRRRRRAAPS